MFKDILFFIKRTKHVLLVVGRTPEKEQTPSFKSVLMVSTSHSGKTNLLLGILNYIVGVSYNDAFRLGFAPELLDKVSIFFFHILTFFEGSSKPL